MAFPTFAVFLTWFVMIVGLLAEDGLILRKPLDIQVRAGNNAYFICKTQPGLQVHWCKNGQKIGIQMRRHTTTLDANYGHALLWIDEVTSDDYGSYECVAVNGTVQQIAGGLLTVHKDSKPDGFPTITKVLANSKVAEHGQNITFTCEAAGSPKPEISWRKDFLIVNYTSNLFKDNYGSLHILNAEEDDGGKYHCIAQNNLGTDISSTTTLFVMMRRRPPTFSIPPPLVQEVMLGASLTLKCVAVGSPMPTVSWRKNDSIDLTPEDSVPIGKNELDLKEVKESANYTCIARSTLGTINATTLIKIRDLD